MPAGGVIHMGPPLLQGGEHLACSLTCNTLADAIASISFTTGPAAVCCFACGCLPPCKLHLAFTLFVRLRSARAADEGLGMQRLQIGGCRMRSSWNVTRA